MRLALWLPRHRGKGHCGALTIRIFTTVPTAWGRRGPTRVSAALPTSAPRPLVSIVVPCRNEADHIRRLLDSILANEYPRERLEVLIIDGMSHPVIQLLDNPKRTTPCALNLGIARARGAVIMRMDAHAYYPPNYVADLVDWLERTGAEYIGGAWVTVPGDTTPTARAIAAVLAHPFGIGDSHYRLGTNEVREVDSLPFGCFRRELFERLGLFDEELVRNQDEEFSFRVLRAGGRVLLVPGVVCFYYARRSLRQLGRMFYQYGLFKPLVALKLGRIMTLRQVVPAAFVLSVLLTIVAAPWIAAARTLTALILGTYVALNAACALVLGWRHGARVGLAAAGVFAVVHVCYGCGFLRGMLALLARARGRASDLSSTPLSR
ncbi:MAG: glycosyltransferase family 2 protein [Gemmatimonadetes bacterium]|nr:MAG: glycosyltransferase family 2 protein [Gemmatimonadota bacterium]